MQQPPHDDSWSVKMDSPYSTIYQKLVLTVQRPVVCAVWSIQLPNFVPSSSFMAGERTIIQGLLLSNFHSESKATPNWIKMRSFEKILSCFEMDNATRCGRRYARLQHPHLNSPRCNCSFSDLQRTESSLIVPDFTFSVYGSSFDYFFLSLIVASLLSLSWYPQGRMGVPRNRQGKYLPVPN